MQNTSVGSYAILNEISRDPYFVTYQGIRTEDDRLVLMKTFSSPTPSPELVAMLKNEYEILKSLNIEGVLKTFSLEVHQNELFLIQEDYPGVYLDKLIRFENLSLPNMLQIAIELVRIIGELHVHGVIHKDIQPQNVLVNLEQMKVKLTGFGLSTRLLKQRPNQRNPALQESSFLYMSPEQTGRMGREMDYRTDFYSLGVTFYELFTGQQPFKGKDALELMHAHVTKNPKALNELKAEISVPLSMVVLKLMSKTIEDRYISATGIEYDLEQCKKGIEKTGSADLFRIATKDHSSRFLMSKRLLGRDHEIFALLHILELVCEGEHHLILLSGESGVGKASIISEVKKPVLQKRGFFISGKCAQFTSDIPYHPFIEAFKELFQQILKESDTKINMWKERINAKIRSGTRKGGTGTLYLPSLMMLTLYHYLWTASRPIS